MVSRFAPDPADVYQLVEYTVKNPDTGKPIHKRINISFDSNGDVNVFGTWRDCGFWTERNFIGEEPIEKLMVFISSKFSHKEVIEKDEKFAEKKQEVVEEIKTIINDNPIMQSLEAKLLKTVPYGSNTNNFLL